MKINKTVVFTTGVFDCLHIGHINLLEKASRFGDELVVGVVLDEAVKRVKGESRPFHNHSDRWRIVESLKFVDRAFIVEDFDPNLIIRKYLEISRLGDRNYLYVFGEDQAHFKPLATSGVLPIILPRTPDVSTTDTLKRMNQ